MDIPREANYKLGHYKIIEVVGGGLWWESHHGLSNCQTGRCFIEGNILVIGPSEDQRPGFLKREFMEHLDRLPTWRKTKYFCSSQTLYQCKTGARLLSISEIKQPADVTFKAPKKDAVEKMGDSGKIQIDRFDGKKHLSMLKEKLGVTWKLLEQWINAIRHS